MIKTKHFNKIIKVRIENIKPAFKAEIDEEYSTLN